MEPDKRIQLSSNDASRRIQKFEDTNSKHVIVLNIGGTIASHRTERGYAPSPPNLFLKELLRLANFHDDSVNLASVRSLPRYTKYGLDPIALPKREDDKLRIFYTMHELLPLLDSSDMNQTDWVRLAVAIQKFYRDFDGFVILHGTDTMCYTSSALSFMLENLGKTIIITGAQIPLVEPDSDAASNLYGSIFIAGNFIIPEVSLYCCNKLYRGNRATKLSANEFEAFSSPNAPPIAVKGTKLKIEWDIIHRSTELEKFRVHTDMDACIAILRLYPGISEIVVKNFLQPPLQGVVLLTFGTGNLPSYLREEIRSACSRGIIVVNVSQCINGPVTDEYVLAKNLYEAGALCGHDMTPEAALTKLIYLFGKGYTTEEIRKFIPFNLRGELSCYSQTNEKETASKLLKAMAEHLSITSKQEFVMLRNVLIPPILCAAAKDGDMDMIRSNLGDLESTYSYNLVNTADYDRRTALHIAVSEGHYDVVECLLKLGASVHQTDRWDQNVLRCAIEYKHLAIIELLKQAGAHLNENECAIGIQICKAVWESNIEVLRAWRLAGATLEETDYSGCTPLQLARKLQDQSIIDYLQSVLNG